MFGGASCVPHRTDCETGRSECYNIRPPGAHPAAWGHVKSGRGGGGDGELRRARGQVLGTLAVTRGHLLHAAGAISIGQGPGRTTRRRSSYSPAAPPSRRLRCVQRGPGRRMGRRAVSSAGRAGPGPDTPAPCCRRPAAHPAGPCPGRARARSGRWHCHACAARAVPLRPWMAAQHVLGSRCQPSWHQPAASAG